MSDNAFDWPEVTPATVFDPPPDPVLDPPAAAAAPKGGRPVTNTRKLVRKVLAVVEATADVRQATAALLGVKDAGDDEELAAAVIDAGKGASAAIDDIVSVRQAGDPFAAVAAAMTLAGNQARFVAAWRLLASVSGLASRPGAGLKPGVAFAQTALALDDAAVATLKLPLELVG